MKKLIAFVGSLLIIAPAIGQGTKTTTNKPQGVSKVKPADVKAAPQKSASGQGKQKMAAEKSATPPKQKSTPQQSLKNANSGK